MKKVGGGGDGDKGWGRDDGVCRGCDPVSGCRRWRGGATMAKYKSKSQPPSFLSSFRLCTAPLSSSFVYSAQPTTTRSRCPGGRFVLYPRSRISSAPFRDLLRGLLRALPTSLCRTRSKSLSSALIRPTRGFFILGPHFGFYPRTRVVPTS